MNKLTKLAFLATTAIALTGCLSTYTMHQPVTSGASTMEYVFEDEVVAIGSAQMGSTKTELVLIGKEKTYLITQGSQEIKQLTQLDAGAMKLNEDKPIEMRLIDDKFSGNLFVEYSKANMTSEEIAKVTGQGFTLKPKSNGNIPRYSKGFRISGTVYAQIDNVKQSAISKGRPIKFYVLNFDKKIDPLKVIDRAILLPFTVVIDAITAPIQALVVVGALAATPSSPNTK